VSAAHTPEPWGVSDRYDVTVPDGTVAVAFGTVTTDEEDMANAARIVACVNACAGLDDPAAILNEVRAVLADIVHRADTTELADGSSLDTLRAHKLLDRLGGAK
jgi:hypothetical protein